MTLLCRPCGRGNWRIVEIAINRSADLFTFRRGSLLTLGDMVLRVVEIRV